MKKVKSLKRFALKAFSLFLCLSFILQQSLLVPVLASEITVAPGSDIGANITQNDNIYNITPGQIHGNTGFAHFGDFNLSEGDIANLIFKMGYDKFVNLVNNGVNINGILNTMKDNNFFNGHAIFVSPGGIVIGASGVLNVGALSLITPSQNSYDKFVGNVQNFNNSQDIVNENLVALKNDTNTDKAITINGKIISRGDVEIYGKNITVAKDNSKNNTAGIVAGVQGQDNLVLSGSKEQSEAVLKQAEDLFNKLVSNDINSGSGYALKDGKVTIVANASNTNEAGLADSKVGKTDPVNASIKVENAKIAGTEIEMLAQASDKLDASIGKVEGATLDAVQNIDDYFDMSEDGAYDDFTGARAHATIDIINSELNSTGDITLGTNAIADTEINSNYISGGKALIYALGNETQSKINITGSNINAGGNVTTAAISQNISNIKISNKILSKLKGEGANAYELMALNHTSKSDTQVIIDKNSTINANNLDAGAVNNTQNNIKIENSIKYQDEGQKAGSTAGISILIKNDRVNTQASINGKVNAKGDVNVSAQNLHVSDTKLSTSGSKYDASKDKDAQQSEGTTDAQSNGIISKIQGIMNSLTNSSDNKNNPTSGSGSSTPAVEMSGVVNLNNSIINTKAEIGNDANVKAGGGVTINANTVDYTKNNATSEATDGAKFAPGVAVVVNSQTNNTNALIGQNAKVTANKDVKLNATTELPLDLASIKLNIKIGDKEIINDGFALTPGSDGSWDFSRFDGSEGDENSYSGIDLSDAEFELSGTDDKSVDYDLLFNNHASSSAAGESVGASGAVVYNTITNNTTAKIADGAAVTSNNGSVILNAVNSVVSYNGAGDLTKLFGGSASGGKVGLGGSVLVNEFSNNASAIIGNNATVNAVNGEVGLYSANEASYLSAIATGTKSDKFALAGSVLVQDISGNTVSQIGSSSVNAKTVNVKAGEGKISTVNDKSGLNDKNSISMNDERNVSDKTSVINIGGSFSKQSETTEEGSGSQSSSGAAVGATVIVNNINKNVNAKVLDGAVINASEKASITAGTKAETMNIGFAGAFAGGVTVDKSKQTGENQSTNSFGGWQDKISSIINKIKGKTSDTDTTVADASGSSVTGHLKDENVQGSLNSTNDQNQTDNKEGVTNTTSQGQNLADSESLSNTANGSTASNNFSAAAAGVVTVESNDSTVEASTGKATINVGKNLEVKASQNNQALNIATGVTKAGNVGAGAAINVSSRGGSTHALMNGTNVNFTSDGEKNLVVSADEDNNNIDVALGVGAASNDQSGTKAAIGGSFNTTVVDNDVKASVSNTTIKNADGKTGNAAVNISANNYSKGYKGAGGVSYTKGSNTNIGAGMAGNINILDKNTSAEISGSTISSASDVNVKTNNRGGKTDDIISFGAGGSVISGGSSSYTFDGAIGVDVIGNTITASIKNSTIDASGAVNAGAYSEIRNSNIAGAAQFSTSSKGLGVGLGTVVNVINNSVKAEIADSTIVNSASVSVTADQIEVLKFLAVNMGLTTSGASSAMANAIVNVMNSDIYSYITGGSINSGGTVTNIANYKNDVQGITAVAGLALGNGNTLGGNIISNIYTNDTQSKINSTVTAGGKVSAKAQSYENINLIPVAAAISTGKFASAANIGANVIVNNTLAEVSGNITSNGLDVIAYDNTDMVTRGGTLAGSSKAGVGGSINVDVLNKTVSAKISDNTIVNSENGKVTVSATAQNASGGKKDENGKYIETDIADIAKILEGSDYSSLEDWQMSYDLAGGGSAGVSGSIITKVVNNNITASVGNNAEITANAVDVTAEDYVLINAIVGNLTAGGKAAVGGSAFVNVVTGTTTATIGDNAVIKSSGDVNVKAENKEVLRTIMVIGSGAGNVAVNGSANVNTVVNTTSASIGDNVKISGLDENSKAGKVTVKASETVDVQSDNLAATGAGTASVGGVAFVNTFKNKVSATVGKENSANKTNIKASSLEVNARSEESVGAITALVSGAGTAGVSGLGIVNVINSQVTAYVDSAVLDITGDVDVKASQDYNKTKYGDKAGLYETLLGLDPGNSDTIDISEYTPIISAINVTGSGTAAVSGSAVVNTIINNVNSGIRNSEIENSSNVNILAASDTVTYDAVGNAAVSGTASVSGTTVVNVVRGNTNAVLDGTTVKKGSVSVKANDTNTLNSILGGITASGVAAVSGYVNENNVVNTTSAKITNSTIGSEEQRAGTVEVNASGINNIAAMSASVGVAGSGANVQGLAVLNQNSAATDAKIENSNITASSLDIEAKNTFNVFDLIAAAGVAGEGAQIGGNAISNVVNNDLTAAITGSKDNIIDISGRANVNAESSITMGNALASAGISGIGAAIGLAVIANVMDNDILSYIDGVTINGGSWKVSAKQTDTMKGGLVGANFGGLAVGVNANGVTNIIQDRTKAYISNAVLNDVNSLDVSAKSDMTLDFNALSVAISGLAGVNVSALVNTVKNELYAGITDSTVSSNGTVKVTTDQDTTVKAVYENVSGGAFAAGTGSIVNVLTNTNTAEIKNTEISKSSSIAVDAQNKTNVTSDNYTAAAGGFAGGLSVNVNVIENEVKAQINNSGKNITTNGELKVNASEDFDLTAKAGVAAGGGVSAAGSSNVNIINNAVLAEINSDSAVNVGSLDVDASSDLNINVLTASAAAGMAGMAGSVSVTSIGSKFEDSDTNDYLVIDGKNSITETQNTANSTVQGNDSVLNNLEIVGKDGEKVNTNYSSGSVELAGTSSKGGTSASVNANITSNGSVDVNASNSLEFNKTNAGAAIGAGALSANVLVTDMNYNTSAILGGTVNAGSNNVSVNAQNTINASTNADQASLGGVTLGGNVAYFKNNAKTTAKIDGASVKAGNVNVIAASKDDISTKAFGAGISGASINAVVSSSKTSNKTEALVSGNVDIDADNMNVKAENSSNLTSEMQAYQASGISVGVLINSAVSNAITNAIINASGDIALNNNLNVIAATNGINTTSTMYLGSLTAIGIGVNEQKSETSASFEASITGSDLTISKAGDIQVLSGVNADNNTLAGAITATVLSKAAQAGFVTVSDTTQTATVNANSTVNVNAKNIKANNLKLASNLNKTATTGSTSSTIGAVSVNSLDLNSTVGGNSSINLAGSSEIANAIDIDMNDTSTAHNEIVDAALTIAEASKNESNAKVNSNTEVNISGKVSAGSVDVDSTAARNAYSTMNTKSGGLVSLGTYNLSTETSGASLVNITTTKDKNINVKNNFDVNSTTTNKTETYLSGSEVALVAVAQGEAKNSISTTNKIVVNGDSPANEGITSDNGNVSFKAENSNEIAMTKNSNTTGFIAIKGGKLINDINSGVNVEINNSKISANNIAVESNVDFSSIGDIKYDDSMEGFITSSGATIDNEITQKNNISIKNSTLRATNRLNIAQKTNSDFHQEVTTEYSAFSVYNKAYSYLTVNNINSLDIDAASTVSGDYVNISQDSSNNLSSKTHTEAHHFAGSPASKSELRLTIDNTINNNGRIEGGNNVQIDFMKNSKNTLVQYANLYAEAAVATGDCSGLINYVTNNKLNIGNDALISSGKDVIVNYSNGNNNLQSDIISKKVSRLLFGIPITKTSHSSNINQSINNSLVLNGEVTAGENYNKYMLIDENGKIDEAKLEGFIQDKDYHIVEGGTIDGTELTEDAKSEIQNQIDYIKNQKEELEKTEASNEEQLALYEQQLEQLQGILDDINASDTISSTEVAQQSKNNIQNAVVGEGDSKISQEKFDEIYGKLSDGNLSEEEIQNYLQNESGLSAEQLATLNNAINAENAKITTTTIGNVETSVYDGKLVFDSEEQNFVNQIQSTIDSIDSSYQDLKTINESISKNVSDLGDTISSLQDQYDYLSQNPLPSVTTDKSAIQFEEIAALPSKIELNGILREDIKGNGQFKIFGSSVFIENYSDYDLIFNNITLNYGNTGLIINGTNYDYLASTGEKVNDNVSLVKEYGNSKVKDSITINNYYDPTNPLLSNAINSNIIFNGIITNGTGALNVLNESGDITFKNLINTQSKDIVASQGNIIYDAEATELNLKNGDRMLAGKDITVNAKKIVNNGKVQAGYGDRNITITDEMLTHFVKDSAGNDTEVIDLQGADVSDYLSENNNIKILYTDIDGDGKKEIVVFNTSTEGGNVTFNGEVSGEGEVKYTNGYSTITITNETDETLVVNNVSNNRMDGQYTINGTVQQESAKIINQGSNFANTTIASNGTVDVKGLIENSKGWKEGDELGQLNITSQNGVNILNRRDEKGSQIATIDAVGNTNIKTENKKGIVVEGLMKTEGTANLTNDAEEGITIEDTGVVSHKNGELNITNNKGDLTISEKGQVIAEETGNINVKNTENAGKFTIAGLIKHFGKGNVNVTAQSNSGLDIVSTGKVAATDGNIVITNEKDAMRVAGTVENEKGTNELTNNGEGGAIISGTITNNNGANNITNNGQGGLTVTETGLVNNNNGTTTVTNNTGKLKVEEGGRIVNNNGQTSVTNNGDGGMEIAGLVNNKSGATKLNNTNAALTVTETGKVQNDNGELELTNTGKAGMKIEGKVTTTNASDIKLTSNGADIIIGHDNTNNNVESGKDVIVNQTNGDVLNYGGKNSKDKTMIAAKSNLIMNVIDGNIGRTDNENPGFSVDASTRDYTDTLNINIGGTITANAINSEANPAGVRLINLRSKDSDMKVNHIKADGNVILTAADWKQPDQNPTPDDEEYFRGYSIINAATDGGANIEGQNISVISSNEIGSSDKALTYNQRTDVNPDSWVSFEAENDIKLENVKSNNPTNVWQLISKRGSIDFTLGSSGKINEITSSSHLHILSKAKDLTIYNLGKTSSFEDPMDDLLYPHDLISLGGNNGLGVVPQTVAIEVLDIDGGADANSTLRIYNAYVRGANNGQGAYEQYLDQTFQSADVSLMADNIYANAYDAASSDVETVHHPDGFDAKKDTVYELDGETHYATGFNTVGEGAKLSFDISGVSKDYVAEVNGGDSSTRTYLETPKYETIEIFNNKYQIPDGTAYRAKDVTLSVNSAPGSADTGNNRGMNINKIYADDAYIDTKDLNLTVRDAIINNYAEFRNGNRDGEGNYGGDYDYRWLTVVDNDYRRLIDSTLQLYTQKTGSFGLDMGNLVILKSQAPAVHYNPYEVANLFRNENSFYRLTYKDDKIQYNTTTPDFKDIDKATYKATKRVSMRFPTKGQDIQSDVPIYDISKTGALIDNQKKLKVGDKEHVKLVYEDMTIDVDVEVVRLTNDGLAGVKFINLSKAAANKILYLNLRRANSMKTNYTSQLQ